MAILWFICYILHSDWSLLLLVNTHGSFHCKQGMLGVRLLIVQCSQLAFVCMYVYIYIYIRHTLIVWARILWSRPQTTSHVVLVRPGGNRKIVRVREPKRSRGHMLLGGSRRRSTCEKDRPRAEMEQKQSKRDHARERRRKQGSLHQKRVRQRRKSLILA